MCYTGKQLPLILFPLNLKTLLFADSVFLPSEEASVPNLQPKPFTVFNENAASALPHEMYVSWLSFFHFITRCQLASAAVTGLS